MLNGQIVLLFDVRRLGHQMGKGRGADGYGDPDENDDADDEHHRCRGHIEQQEHYIRGEHKNCICHGKVGHPLQVSGIFIGK